MNDFEDEKLPSDLTDIGERMRSSRPIPSKDALDRVMTRAQRVGGGRRSLFGRRAGAKRTVAATVATTALALGIVGSASALTISLAGLGANAKATIAAALRIQIGPAQADVVISDSAAAQYAGNPCISALVTLGQLQAGVIINQLTVTIQQGLVDVICGGATPVRHITATTTPVPVSFGSVNRGSNSASKTVTFLSDGTAPVSGFIPAITPLGAQFQITGGTCGLLTSLAPGTTCTVNVRFSPSISVLGSNPSGTKTGNLTLTSTATPSAVSVGLTGNAT